jgi:excisionase family DNA binding protein
MGTEREFTSKKYLTSEEAAEYLGGLNHRTVTRWAQEGYIPAIPIGEGKRRLWRFLVADLDHWMLSRRTGQFQSEIETAQDTLIASRRCSDQRTSQ